MRIFVTGASGWIGSAVVPELRGAGHEVVGLARSEASAQALEAAGAMVQRGDLDDPDGLAKAAADSDGVIHLAFQHEVAFGGNFAAAGAADRRAVEAMGAALADSDRPFVLASGLLGVTAGRVATEDDGLVPGAEIRANPAGVRAATAAPHTVPEGRRRPLVGAAPPADGPRRRRQRVHGHHRRHRPTARRGRIRGGRNQSLAGRAPHGRRPPRPPRRRGGPRRLGLARGRRRGSRLPGDRARDGPSPGRPLGVRGPRRCRRALRPSGPLHRLGQPRRRRRDHGSCSDGSRSGPRCSRISSRTTTTARPSSPEAVVARREDPAGGASDRPGGSPGAMNTTRTDVGPPVCVSRTNSRSVSFCSSS